MKNFASVLEFMPEDISRKITKLKGHTFIPQVIKTRFLPRREREKRRSERQV